MSEAVRERLVEVRRRHPTWGPGKLLGWLEAREPRVDWPAASSVGELLRREGLVAERRRPVRREPHPGPPQVAAVLDPVSRKCLALDGLCGTEGDGARPLFERVFGEAGLAGLAVTDAPGRTKTTDRARLPTKDLLGRSGYPSHGSS